MRFDDVLQLTPLISTGNGEWSAERTVTHSEIDAFGHLTDDLQWIHAEAARTRKTPVRLDYCSWFPDPVAGRGIAQVGWPDNRRSQQCSQIWHRWIAVHQPGSGRLIDPLPDTHRVHEREERRDSYRLRNSYEHCRARPPQPRLRKEAFLPPLIAANASGRTS